MSNIEGTISFNALREMIIGKAENTYIELDISPIEGELTQEDIDVVMERMYASACEDPVRLYLRKERVWMLEYARAGKWYPSPRKRKSKMRMSKKWREYDNTS